MNRIATIILILFLLSPGTAADAQGLKGLEGINKRFGRMEFVKGANDQERWKTFLKAQPKLIGMTEKQINEVLGAGTPTNDGTELYWHLTDEPVKSGLGKKTWWELSIKLRNGVAYSFNVEAR